MGKKDDWDDEHFQRIMEGMGVSPLKKGLGSRTNTQHPRAGELDHQAPYRPGGERNLGIESEPEPGSDEAHFQHIMEGLGVSPLKKIARPRVILPVVEADRKEQAAPTGPEKGWLKPERELEGPGEAESGSDDEPFDRIMARLGVTAIRKEGPEPKSHAEDPGPKARFASATDPADLPKPAERPAPATEIWFDRGDDEPADTTLFRNEIERMGPVPAKEDRARAQSFKVRKKVHKIKWHQSLKVKPQDELDLHGKKTEEALRVLALFVGQSHDARFKSVAVITGKGKHSKDGLSRLRPSVEDWILSRGDPFIETYCDAPRELGGNGAFVLFIRPF